ncbi:AMP-binding protein [Pseudomonas abyssi]|uniref:Long-chain-fatty-acid--CoA ligase n=1 Tax=Pseudomonas abyssi TaxID=170540 RepID=A0A395R1P2_9PSED|nr:AMP-binding protein [Halopseudomonas gallaeciensis]RGP53689.1 long-chain fatty acid--CoA ligase [Halopseudomonas gallaeciensis]
MTESRLWERRYPPALQNYQLAPDLLQGNLAQWPALLAERYGDSPAFTLVLPNGLTADLSFSQVQALSDQLAAWLIDEQQMQVGEVVAVQLPNSLHYPVAVLGAWKAGLIVTNVNPLYTEREVRNQLADSGARLLIACDLFVERAAPIAQALGIALLTTSLGDFFPPEVGRAIAAQAGVDVAGLPRVVDALAAGAALPLPAYRANPVALYQYTGGTTGRSKGAVLTHANLQAVLQMAEDYITGFGMPFAPGDVILTVPPLYHIFAFNFNFLLFYRSGGRNLLVPNPRPLSNLQPAFEQFAVHWMTGVDTLFAGLLAEPWFLAKPPALKAAVSGGTALRPTTQARWLATAGQILEGYGLTESSCFVAFNPPGEHCRPGTVGLPLPGCDLLIRDAAGNACTVGEPGELLIRGPHVVGSYLNRPDENREAFCDGWFNTGDIAVMDEQGYLRIVDRKKDLILVSGFNVYPNEVEDVLAEHPDVAEVAVVGVPDDSTGEAIRAFVALRSPGVSAEQLILHCRERLTAYKVPRQILFREQLPKSPVGKILRAELRAEQ